MTPSPRLRRRLRRGVALAGLATLALAAGAAADAPAVRARLSVTLERGSVLPGPFAPVPDGRIAVFVPEADGILLLRGDDILHHFPVPEAALGLDDLAASADLLVAGRREPSATHTVELVVFDLHTGLLVERVRSANPLLAGDPGAPDPQWRVVVEGQRVGVYHPGSGATYPLWERATGTVPGRAQVGRASVGIGLSGGTSWVPADDGALARATRGRTEPFLPPGEGDFVGGTDDGRAVLLRGAAAGRPRRAARALELLVASADGARTLLRPAAAVVDVEGRELPARPARVHGDEILWLWLGPDYLEIRAAPLPRPADAP